VRTTRWAVVTDGLKVVAAAAVLSLVAGATPALAAGIDVCGLVSRADVQNVLGAAPTHVPRRAGPAPDQNYPKATNTSCGFLNEEARIGLAVMLLEFPSRADAEAAMSKAKEDGASTSDPTASVTAEKGIGDGSYWMTSKDGVGYLARRGQRLLAVGVAAETTIPPGMRPKLRTITQNALGHL
jgi:hypothetical protein